MSLPPFVILVLQSDTAMAKWEDEHVGYSRVPVPGESLLLPKHLGGQSYPVLAVTHLPFEGEDLAARVTLKTH